MEKHLLTLTVIPISRGHRTIDQVIDENKHLSWLCNKCVAGLRHCALFRSGFHSVFANYTKRFSRRVSGGRDRVITLAHEQIYGQLCKCRIRQESSIILLQLCF